MVAGVFLSAACRVEGVGCRCLSEGLQQRSFLKPRPIIAEADRSNQAFGPSHVRPAVALNHWIPTFSGHLGMLYYSVEMGEGIAGALNTVGGITTSLYSCIGITMINEQAKVGGLYHYPAERLGRNSI